MATDIPVSVWMQQVLRQSDLIDLALRKSQGKTMTEEKQTLEDISATIIAKAIRNQLAIDQAHLREALTKEVDSSASVYGTSTQRSRPYSDGRNQWRKTAIKCAGSEVLYIQGQKPWGRLNKKKKEMMRCAVYSKDSDSLKKHREKMPHYRKNSKPSLVQKLLGRSEFTKISND